MLDGSGIMASRYLCKVRMGVSLHVVIRDLTTTKLYLGLDSCSCRNSCYPYSTGTSSAQVDRRDVFVAYYTPGPV
jgi:hypothetical protein